MRKLGAVLTFVLVAGCGKVERPSLDGAADDHRDDGGSGVVADASGPDATPVACAGPEDCMNPDDPCLLPGTCEENVCHFEAMDCSDLDGECTTGICRDGECRPKAVRQDQACGAGIMACGDFQGCGGFVDVCDESGTESRSCTDSTCQAGECVTGSPYTDTRGCSRDTDGTGCGDTTYDCTGFCSYTSVCDNSDNPIECVQTDYACGGGNCTPSQSNFQEPCVRDTEGLPCGPDGDGCCTPSGTCAFDCF